MPVVVEALLQIGNAANSLTVMPTPSEFQVDIQDIDSESTTRTASGLMTRDRVRGGASAVRKLEAEWAYLTDTQVKTILEAVQAEFFYVRYPDPLTGAMRTGHFYVGDRTMPMYHRDATTGESRWESLKMNFIEE